MKTLAIVFVVLAAASAVADPITAKLGKQKVTLTPCTIDGPELDLGATWSGLVATPDGALLVLDHDGGVRRYTVATGADCRVTPDKTFGKDGVIASGITPKADYPASLTMDRAGAIYIESASMKLRIAGGKVAKMCLDGDLTASPRSYYVWRGYPLDRTTRTDGECKDRRRMDLSHHALVFGKIVAIDDRIVVEIGDDLEVRDVNGILLGKLANRDHLGIESWAWAACGKGFCAADLSFYAWGADGKLLGGFDTQILSSTAANSWYTNGFATSGTTGWLLGVEHPDDEAPVDWSATPAILFRVEGLPR